MRGQLALLFLVVCARRSSAFMVKAKAFMICKKSGSRQIQN